MWHGSVVAALGLALLLAAAQAAHAQAAPDSALLGNLGGLRDGLAARGITLNLQETSELFANTTGGTARQADYDGEAEAAVQLDTGMAFGLPGGTFAASAIDVHGRNLSTDTLDVWQTLTSAEADRGVRLWELWYQQHLPGGIDLRLGQQSLDQEFVVDSDAVVLVNGAFGWPLLPALDLPGGGPAYPLSVPGARLHVAFGSQLSLLAGVFNGSPLPNGCERDPQRCNASGTNFPLNGGQMAIAELQWSVPGAMGPAGTYKLGGWFDTRDFADRLTATDGRPLADTLGSGVPRQDHGDWSLYGLVDRTLWRSTHGLASLGVFARAEGAPGDRNLVDFSATAGMLLRAPFARRDQDAASLGIGYGAASSAARENDLTAERFGTGRFARSGETLLEATYLAQLRGWLQVQPDMQYVFNPGGGIADPAASSRRLRNALVLGSRLNIVF